LFVFQFVAAHIPVPITVVVVGLSHFDVFVSLAYQARMFPPKSSSLRLFENQGYISEPGYLILRTSGYDIPISDNHPNTGCFQLHFLKGETSSTTECSLIA
jgi:hypothetical protein